MAKTITWLLTRSWPVVDGLLKVPPFFMRLHLPLLPHSKVLKQVTGMKMDFGRFTRVGARGYTLERLFNLREGFSKHADTLPGRFTDEPLPESKKKSTVPLGKMLPKYYKLRGWDADGIPKEKTLKKLGLKFAVPAVIKQ